MRRVAGGERPERTADAARFYDGGEGATAEAYTAAGATTQRELAAHCLALLGDLPRHAVLADLGSGSGLSGTPLTLFCQGHASLPPPCGIA